MKSEYVVEQICSILRERKEKGDNKIILNTNLILGLPLENINKIAGPMIEAWACDLKYISNADISYNPALGTGQIQIKDIHYVSHVIRTTWEMCQLLDGKYLRSSRRTIEDFYREAIKNNWIK
ncbi:MAG: hypothetical protein GX913_01995 [Clostridiales bacterium]|nr:hypothetical protein [Clostridiales bacterium]